LIGTPALKAYMHGYFMELKGYQKLLSAVNPFAYEKFKKEQIQNRIKEQTEKRINVKAPTAKVNFDYVKELESKATDAKGKSALGVLNDSRFKDMFEDQEYAIDKASESYKLLKPTQGARKAQESDDEQQEKQQTQSAA
jgi:ribosome biogenesis protein ENP2